jgi:hypothetical protein
MSNNNIPQANATTSIPHNLNYNQSAHATAIQQNSSGPVLVQGQGIIIIYIYIYIYIYSLIKVKSYIILYNSNLFLAITQDQYRNINNGNRSNVMSSEAICRSCGRPFVRPQNCHDASAQFYRCENCNVLKLSDFCIIS